MADHNRSTDVSTAPPLRVLDTYHRVSHVCMFCVQEFSSMMVEVEPDHAERRINTLQQHYKRRRLAEHDEEVYLTCR
jgi:hypothetical protein